MNGICKMMIAVGMLTLALPDAAAAYYSPALGRFVQRDPLGYVDGMHLYAYQSGRPTSALDSAGLSEFERDEWGGPRYKYGEWWFAFNYGIGHAMDDWALQRWAFNLAQRSRLGGIRSGRQDAFRHCLWSCSLTRKKGALRALMAGDAHENSNPSSTDPNEDRMDRWNNRVGCSIGRRRVYLLDDDEGHAFEDCYNGCMRAIRDGRLRILRYRWAGNRVDGTELGPSNPRN